MNGVLQVNLVELNLLIRRLSMLHGVQMDHLADLVPAVLLDPKVSPVNVVHVDQLVQRASRVLRVYPVSADLKVSKVPLVILVLMDELFCLRKANLVLQVVMVFLVPKARRVNADPIKS